jgi:periplasmic protein CpxP/Spy
MRTIGKLTWIFCVLGWAGTLAFAVMLAQEPEQSGPANPPGTPASRPAGGALIEKRLQNMSERLGLTGDQQEKIRPILQSEMDQLRAVRSDSNMPQGEARKRMQKIRRSTHEQIRGVLTPEQREKWQAQYRGQGHRPGGTQPPDAPANPSGPQ